MLVSMKLYRIHLESEDLKTSLHIYNHVYICTTYAYIIQTLASLHKQRAKPTERKGAVKLSTFQWT